MRWISLEAVLTWEWDATLPLDELWMDPKLHMDDFRDPSELGLLGGVCRCQVP